MPVARKITAEVLAEVQAAIAPGRTYLEIARELGVDAVQVAKISQGEHLLQQSAEEQRRRQRQCTVTPRVEARIRELLEQETPAAAIAEQLGVTARPVLRVLLKVLSEDRDRRGSVSLAPEGNEAYAPPPAEIEAQCRKLRLMHLDPDGEAWTPPEIVGWRPR